MTRAEAIWHANHVFNIVIERCINAQNLKEAREFDEAKQIVIEALGQEPIVRCKDCVKWCKGDDLYGICNWNEYRTLRTTKDSFCSYGKRESDGE